MSRWRPFLGWSVLVSICAAMSFTYLQADTKSDDDEDDAPTDKKYATKVDTPMVGDYTTFSGLQPITLEGVGLVVGLNGTGGDPAPSVHRTQLMNELKRRGVPNPNAVLQSPSTALVVIRARLPPLMKKGEVLDLDIQIPESAEATSLAGGWLMETYLTEQAYIQGNETPLKGHAYATARGAVLTVGIGSEAATSPELLKRGRVLGGAKVLKERDLALYLRHDQRSVRNSQRLATVIGKRFHDFDEQGIKKPMAKAKTDQKIILSVHPRYKDNYPRYLQVIRHLAFREDAVAARVRLQRLQKEIFTPDRAEECSLELEAIGTEAIPSLKHALTSPLLEVRFYAAMALAYLGNSDGLPALMESARKERAFRMYALTAMATLDDAEAHMALRELMGERSAETRYGAFRALWTLDRQDPFIRGEVLGVNDEDQEDKSKVNQAGKYIMHSLETTGEPMVHALTRTRPEIVLFGADQELRTPLYLAAGRHIVITAQPGSTTISLAKFEVGQPDQRLESSLKVADVIRAASKLGAHYPDIVQMLADASSQKNLPTRLGIDELPEGGRVYYRPSASGDGSGQKRRSKVGRQNQAPNLFPEKEGPDVPMPGKKEKSSDSRGNMANVPEQKSKQNESANSKSAKTDPKSKSTRSSSKESDSKEDDKPKSMFSWMNIWKKNRD